MASKRGAQYDLISTRARNAPGIWVKLRDCMSTANLVTEIRAGKHQSFPPTEFEARAYRQFEASEGPNRYGIEVRYVPEAQSDAAHRDSVEKLVRDMFEDSIQKAIEAILELKPREVAPKKQEK